MSSEDGRAYVLVEIKAGKEKEFGDEMLSKGLVADSVHGSFDSVIILRGPMMDIDSKIMEVRKSPFVRKTVTLLCSGLFDWEDISGRMNE
jgi:hypothetical protein